MSSISSLLSKLNVGKLKMGNGRTVEQNLRYEATRLLKCIQDEIDNYYDSYKPSQYTRNDRFKEALYAEEFLNIDVVRNTMYINLHFNPDLSYHDSFSGEEVYVPLLINDGWCHSGYTGVEDHFHKYSGFHFLEKGIDKWNATNSMKKLKVHLSKTWDGNKYSDIVYG